MLNTITSFFLIIFIFVILFITSKIYVNYFDVKSRNKDNFLKKYMGIIYIVFSILKLYDLSKFADIFSKYDIIGSKFNFYSYLYPFIEILLGILLLKDVYVKDFLRKKNRRVFLRKKNVKNKLRIFCFKLKKKYVIFFT